VFDSVCIYIEPHDCGCVLNFRSIMDSNTTIYFQNKVTYMFQLIFSHHQNYKTISNINICMGLRFQKQNINMQSWEKFGGYKTVPLCKILNITEKKILNM